MILLSSFVFGLIFGSFLNVIIYRLRNDLSIFGRSFCPYCRTQLKWHDLVPILSFIYLRGRCRYCGKKISWQYPIVELLSGFLWVGIFYKFGILPTNIYYIFILSALLIIAVYDFKWRIIPDKVVYPAIAAALIFSLLNIEIFIFQLFTAAIFFTFFFAIFYFSSGKAMGFGDAKMAFLIGLFLAPSSAILAFVLSFLIGAVFGIILLGISKVHHPLVYKEWGMKSQIAFGPFLAVSAAIVFLFSNFIYRFINF